MDFGWSDLAYAVGVGTKAFAQHESGSYKAEIAAMNERIANEGADHAIFRGRQQENQLRREYAQLEGNQRAILAAQGMDLGADTALNIQMDTARQEELDVLTLRNNVAMEAWGYRIQAYDYKNVGAYAKHEGNVAAFTTVLAGATDYAFASGLLDTKKKPKISKG